MYSTIFFYRLDRIIDENEFFQKNPNKKQDIVTIFLDFIIGKKDFFSTKTSLRLFSYVGVDMLFIAQGIRDSIPKTSVGDTFLDCFSRLGHAVNDQTLSSYSQGVDNRYGKNCFDGMDLSCLGEQDMKRVMLASNLGTLTTEIVIRSLGIDSISEHQQFFYILGLLNSYLQLTDDKWDENIDIYEGQSTAYSELEKEVSRSRKKTRHKEIENIRIALKRKYFEEIAKLPKEQKELLQGLLLTTTPILYMKSFKN